MFNVISFYNNVKNRLAWEHISRTSGEGRLSINFTNVDCSYNTTIDTNMIISEFTLENVNVQIISPDGVEIFTINTKVKHFLNTKREIYLPTFLRESFLTYPAIEQMINNAQINAEGTADPTALKDRMLEILAKSI